MRFNNVHDTKMAHKNTKCPVSLCDYSGHATNNIPFLLEDMLDYIFTFRPQNLQQLHVSFIFQAYKAKVCHIWCI